MKVGGVPFLVRLKLFRLYRGAYGMSFQKQYESYGTWMVANSLSRH